MYTKDQEETALREYERLGSVAAVIHSLGYPSESTLYRWYECKKNRAGKQTSRDSHNDGSSLQHAPRHPSAEFKYEVIHRCFEVEICTADAAVLF